MKLGVALGGGGVRGLAHVLALEAIDACGVTPAAIAGTSMGAIVGALYASGRSGREIHQEIERHIITEQDGLKEILEKKRDLIKWLRIVRPAWKGSGLLRADGFLEFLLDEIRVESFEELKIPLRVMATDFHAGEAVVLEEGPLLPAIRASMSIPGLFVPVEHEGRILVDGGIVDNLPCDLLPDDCDVTIAVDVTPARHGAETEPPNVVEAVLGMFDILIHRQTVARVEERAPTIYIHPRLTGIPMLDFEKIEQVWKQAEPAMVELRSRLEELLESS